MALPAGKQFTLRDILGVDGKAKAKAQAKGLARAQAARLGKAPPEAAPVDERPLLTQWLDHRTPVERVARMVETRCCRCGNTWRGPLDNGGAFIFLRSRIGQGSHTLPHIWEPLTTHDAYSHLPFREDWAYRNLAFCPACIDQGELPA